MLYLCKTERMVCYKQVLTSFSMTMKDMKDVFTIFLIENI